jgi:KUP system potassium uptake protein
MLDTPARRSEVQLSTGSGLTVAALGVVYGDIGTSPLYAVRQSLVDFGDLSEPAILGALSLIVWALALVVTVKYVLVIMRADNRGEGGLLALTALVLRTARRTQKRYTMIMAAGLVGAALFYGDGVITPAISVLSAVEGEGGDAVLRSLCDPDLARPAHRPLPDAVPRYGECRAPLWPGDAGLVRRIGAARLVGNCAAAAHPVRTQPALRHRAAVGCALARFRHAGGGVPRRNRRRDALRRYGTFRPHGTADGMAPSGLSSTRAELLWAGAMLLGNPAALEHPFYRLAPEWGLYPLVALASIATIIASQAVISGAFSITRQAVQLGYLPRLEVRHTSEEEIGQVYVPRINSGLFVAIIVLVLGFRSSDNLGAAYGIAVSGMMAITTGLAFLYMRSRGWSLALAVPLFAVFALVDLTFLSANLLKICEGGWFPIVVAALVFAIMATWWRGRRLLAEKRARDALPLHQFVDGLNPEKPARVPGTAIFMTRDLGHVPAALLHALKHYKVLHERVVMMQVETEDVPHVPEDQRLEIGELGKGFYTIRVRYGFMDEPNVLRALAQCRVGGLRFNLMETSFIIGRERVRPRPRRTAFWRWRDRLFSLMTNNMLDATEFFRIPPNRVVELGGQIEI